MMASLIDTSTIAADAANETNATDETSVPIAAECLAEAAAAEVPPQLGTDEVVLETGGSYSSGMVVATVLTGRHLYSRQGKDDRDWLHDEAAQARLRHDLKTVPLETIESVEWTRIWPERLAVRSGGVKHDVAWVGSLEDRLAVLQHVLRLARGGNLSAATAMSGPMPLWYRLLPVMTYGGDAVLVLALAAAGGWGDGATRMKRLLDLLTHPAGIAFVAAWLAGVIWFSRDRIFGSAASPLARHRITWAS